MKYLFNKQITEKNIDQEIELYGWVDRVRKLGKVTFINLRDNSAIIQLVVTDQSSISQLTKESVIKVIGKVVHRKNVNHKMLTGKIEVLVQNITILSTSKELPFEIHDTSTVKEDIRIKNRFLDLRSSRMLKNIRTRHNLFLEIRNFLNKNDFLEIETPLLSKPTPEGARDYLIPTRFQETASFFSLPQSPQMYKQLLMVGGIERYFQITKVFRDEDLRADRQLEFTQLDMELSFTSPNQIQQLVESMMNIVLKNMDYKIKLPFKHITYHESLDTFGTDKPDLRFGLQLINVTNFFNETNFNAFQNQESIKIIHTTNKLNKKQVNLIEETASKNGNTRVAIIEIENKKPIGSLVKFMELELQQIIEKFKIETGSIFIVANKKHQTNISLGAIRVELNKMFKLADENSLEFVWVEDWPLYEYSDKEEKYISAHHPFTSPSKACEKTFDKDMKNAKAIAYDLVLNGYEVAGGSIRINDIEIQKRVFRSLGLREEEINNKFGFLLNAFNYGVPPHGGIAFGLDRLVMILAKETSIREVIAFPKNSKGYDPLISAPTVITEQLLNEYKLKFK